MRISTNNFFDASSARLSDLQAKLDQTSQQIASGRKLLSPAQDPGAAVQVLELSQAKASTSNMPKTVWPCATRWA